MSETDPRYGMWRTVRLEKPVRDRLQQHQGRLQSLVPDGRYVSLSDALADLLDQADKRAAEAKP